MRKEEAVERLKELGLDSELKDGVVMVYVSRKDYQKVKELEKTIKDIGYRASWGIAVRDEQ